MGDANMERLQPSTNATRPHTTDTKASVFAARRVMKPQHTPKVVPNSIAAYLHSFKSLVKRTVFIVLQYITPQLLVTKVAGALSNSTRPIIKNALIRCYMKTYGVDLSEAKITSPEGYASFNEFFSRELMDGARPSPESPTAVASPVDGKVSQTGLITDGRIVQAKKHDYSVRELLGDDEPLTQAVEGGQFATLYLSPSDYHRVHMPTDAKLIKTTYVPGKLFSVNETATNHIPNLISQNERLVCHFETNDGPMVMVLVGAMIVASLNTAWAGAVPRGKTVVTQDYQDRDIRLKRGEYMGHFNLGSTVVMLFSKEQTHALNKLNKDDAVRVGNAMGQLDQPQ